MKDEHMGVVVQRKSGDFTVIETGRRLAIGYGRLYVRDRLKRDVAIFEPGEWLFAALCNRDEIAIASRAKEGSSK